jgi:N-acetyl-alpha-D-glucosaminyl L-malate synthase BshA
MATEIGCGLAERGHDVHFICAHPSPRLLASKKVTIHSVSSPQHPLIPHGEFTLALASALAEVGARHALDVMQVHYALPLATSALLARELMGKSAPRLVTTVHGTDVLTLGMDPAFHPMVRLALQRSDAATAPSRFLAHATESNFGLAENSVEVISNFVDTARFHPVDVSSRPTFWPEKVKVITHSSNFRSLKRVDLVVRIFARVKAELPCKLVLIGDGPERAAVEQLVQELELQSSVHFLGEQQDLVPWLLASHVFVLPSEIESFGLSALEAMSCGVPVVATTTGGIPEVVVDGVTGFLHPVGDVEAMAQSTLRLLQDEPLHRRFAVQARTHAVDRWRGDLTLDAFEMLYRRLL